MQSKQELRKFAKELRKTLDINSISERILQIFLSADIYKSARNIACYYPYGTELNIIPIFKDTSKNFYLPKMNENDEMTFHSYKSGDVLLQNSYGIFEPTTEKINPNVIDLMIIPALMADKQGYRLGYGKGCYDKFLNTNHFSGNKIVLIADKLITNSLPHDKFDITINTIITDKEIININNK